MEWYYKMDQILLPDKSQNKGGLFLSSCIPANDEELLKNNKIKAVINCASEVKIKYKESLKITHLVIDGKDVPGFQIQSFFQTTNNFIETNLKKTNVLIHCQVGVSRSASIIIAYLMYKNKWTFDNALQFVKQKRFVINPNNGFVSQLKEYQFLLGIQNQ